MQRRPRNVPPSHALAWYGEAMRLWKRAPLAFCGLALVILAANLGLNLLPVAGLVAGQVLLPLLECSLIYASLATDRGDRPRLRHLVAIAGASPVALAAVAVAGLAVFVAEALAGSAFGDIDMLSPSGGAQSISDTTLVAVYGVGMLVSLPLTFVPFAALFDGAGFRHAFAQSYAAFARNPLPLLLYGALSFALLMLGLATNGVGLLLALPWSAVSSYAAWKDIFAVS